MRQDHVGFVFVLVTSLNTVLSSPPISCKFHDFTCIYIWIILILYVYHIFINQSFVDRHQGWPISLHNRAAVNMNEQVSLHHYGRVWSSLSMYSGSEWLGQMIVLIFNSVRPPHTNGCICTPIKMNKSSSSPIPSPTFAVLFLFFFNLRKAFFIYLFFQHIFI